MQYYQATETSTGVITVTKVLRDARNRLSQMCVILPNERSYLESEYRRYIYPSEGIRILPNECIQPEYEPENGSLNSVKLVPRTASSWQAQPRLVGARLNNRA